MVLGVKGQACSPCLQDHILLLTPFALGSEHPIIVDHVSSRWNLPSQICIPLQKSLRLTEQQKCELMELRQWVLPRVGRLMRERERISKALQACTKDTHKQVGSPSESSCNLHLCLHRSCLTCACLYAEQHDHRLHTSSAISVCSCCLIRMMLLELPSMSVEMDVCRHYV